MSRTGYLVSLCLGVAAASGCGGSNDDGCVAAATQTFTLTDPSDDLSASVASMTTSGACSQPVCEPHDGGICTDWTVTFDARETGAECSLTVAMTSGSIGEFSVRQAANQCGGATPEAYRVHFVEPAK